MHRMTWGGLVFVAALLAGGCAGTGKLATRGVVLKDGSPLKIGQDDIVRILLVPLPDDGSKPKDCYVAQFYPDNSTFVVKGKDGEGMPPGKYRVAVEQLQGRKDVLKGAFGYDNSPFVCTIGSANDEITVDVGKAK
jgi:hypothetical protein